MAKTLAPASENEAVRNASQLREDMAERFFAYDEVRALPASDREALFHMLLRAQEGDNSILRDIYQLVYDELPVPFDEFMLGKKYLGLKNKVNEEKLYIMREFTKPEVRKLFCAAGSGSGKALALDTPLPTPTGWTTMADVRPGDLLYDEQGQPCRVVAKSPVHRRPCYRLRFDDGSVIDAADDHYWQAIDLRTRRRYTRYRQPLDWRDRWAASRSVSSAELATTVFVPKSAVEAARNWAIPCARPLRGRETTLPVPPYTLGFWLGDGVGIYAAVTVGHPDVSEVQAALATEGVTLLERPSARRSGSSAYSMVTTVPGVDHRGRRLVVRPDGYVEGAVSIGLRQLGVHGNKHVPPLVLRADASTRLAVLQGLMDADGFLVRRGTCAEVGIDLTHKPLADGVAELVRSFGWKTRQSQKPARLYGRDCGTVYRLRFRPDLPVFRLRRKGQQFTLAQASRHTARWLADVQPLGEQDVACVQVDSPSHLYLAGEAMVPTHNSFMVSCIQCWEIYNLLCLKRPDLYYMLGPGSKIATVNLSVGKEQAKDVVFAEFVGRLSHAPWFHKKFKPQVSRCIFPKDVFALSGGSGATSYYGYHTKMGCVDEASFMIDREGRSQVEELIEALIKSLTTRFPTSYKLMVISTLRDEEDYLYVNIERIKEDGVPLLVTTDTFA